MCSNPVFQMPLPPYALMSLGVFGPEFKYIFIFGKKIEFFIFWSA